MSMLITARGVTANPPAHRATRATPPEEPPGDVRGAGRRITLRVVAVAAATVLAIRTTCANNTTTLQAALHGLDRVAHVPPLHHPQQRHRREADQSGGLGEQEDLVPSRVCVWASVWASVCATSMLARAFRSVAMSMAV